MHGTKWPSTKCQMRPLDQRVHAPSVLAGRMGGAGAADGGPAAASDPGRAASGRRSARRTGAERAASADGRRRHERPSLALG